MPRQTTALMISLHIPTRPSGLRIALSPIAPARPASVFAGRYGPPSGLTKAMAPPPVPQAWTWTCHVCRSCFPLGATRRCLHDGHLFCPGASFNRRTGRVKRHRACDSAFDYAGWRAWGEWRARTEGRPETRSRGRRARVVQTESGAMDVDFEAGDGGRELAEERDCSRRCMFPSECRWSAARRTSKTDNASPRRGSRAGSSSTSTGPPPAPETPPSTPALPPSKPSTLLPNSADKRPRTSPISRHHPHTDPPTISSAAAAAAAAAEAPPAPEPVVPAPLDPAVFRARPNRANGLRGRTAAAAPAAKDGRHAAIAKLQYLQVYLEDSTLPLDQEQQVQTTEENPSQPDVSADTAHADERSPTRSYRSSARIHTVQELELLMPMDGNVWLADVDVSGRGCCC